MRSRPLLAVVALACALGVAGCGGADDTHDGSGSSSSSAKTKLALVAYSTPQVVYDEIIPAFAKTPAGDGVGFTESFGASGDQSRAVEAGLPADVVAFALEPDITRLTKAGLVADDWAANKYNGIASNSVVVFAVRKGNPKNIKTWDDLLKKGVEVVTPNPFSSGGARWNLMAGYGAQLKQGKTPAQALDYLRVLLTRQVKVQDKSAREALQTFTGGKGDVLLAYENEAITAQQKGEDVDYVVPSQTILIETPIAVSSKSKHLKQANAFRDYVWSAAGQDVFAKHGYRPVDKTVFANYADKFPVPSSLFTIGYFGGWKTVTEKFFDPDKGLVAKIEDEAGVSTAK